jgi:hypothetical protein
LNCEYDKGRATCRKAGQTLIIIICIVVGIFGCMCCGFAACYFHAIHTDGLPAGLEKPGMQLAEETSAVGGGPFTTVDVTFTPGKKLGLKFYGGTGTVEDVLPDSQAADNGVQINWIANSVASCEYSFDKLKECHAGSTPFVISFLCPASPVDAKPAVVGTSTGIVQATVVSESNPVAEV